LEQGFKLSQEKYLELEKHSLLIAIPHNQDMENKHFRLGMDMVKNFIGGEWKTRPDDLHFNNKNDWTIKWESDFVHGQIMNARNKIARDSLDANYEYTCMIDSDMGNFSPDLFHLLLNSMLENNADIMSVLCYSRHGNREGVPQCLPAVLKMAEDGHYYSYEDIPHFGGVISGNLISGTGCIMIKNDVFKKLEMPYFNHVNDYSEFKEKGIVKETGEDIYFCLKALEAGYKVLANTDLFISHFGMVALPYEFFNELTPVTKNQHRKNMETFDMLIKFYNKFKYLLKGEKLNG
jgi:hypothetical protein